MPTDGGFGDIVLQLDGLIYIYIYLNLQKNICFVVREVVAETHARTHTHIYIYTYLYLYLQKYLLDGLYSFFCGGNDASRGVFFLEVS